MRWIDLFVKAFSPAAFITGLIVYVTSIFLCFDPLFLVLQDAFRNGSQGSLICLSVRLYFTFVTLEAARTFSFLFILFVVPLDMILQNIQTTLTLVSRRSPNVHSCLARNIRLTLFYRNLATTANIGLSTLYSGIFWVLVLAGWIIINGYELVPLYMYLMIVVMAPVLFTIVFAMLVFVSTAADMSEVVTRKLQNAASDQVQASGFDRKLKIILKKRCKSIVPFAVQYVPVTQPISRVFARNWLQNIVDRLFDAILLF